MTAVDDPIPGDSLPLDDLRERLEDQPVRLAVLFGSHATGETHTHSDVDLAIELDGLRPGDDGYNDALFGVIATASETLDTDDVDVVDVHTLSPRFAHAVFETAVLVYGSRERLETLAETIPTAEPTVEEARKRVTDAADRLTSGT